MTIELILFIVWIVLIPIFSTFHVIENDNRKHKSDNDEREKRRISDV